MLAFEVSLNGEVLYTAGMREGNSLSTRIHAFDRPEMPKRVSLSTSIPKSSNGPEKAVWWGQHYLVVGDSIIVRIVDVQETDSPKQMPGAGALRALTRASSRRLRPGG